MALAPKTGLFSVVPKGFTVDPNAGVAPTPNGFVAVGAPKTSLVSLLNGSQVSSIAGSRLTVAALIDTVVFPTPFNPMGPEFDDAKKLSLLLLQISNKVRVPSVDASNSPCCFSFTCNAAMPSGYAYSSSSSVGVIAFDPSWSSESCQSPFPSFVTTLTSLPTLAATKSIEVLSLATI